MNQFAGAPKVLEIDQSKQQGSTCLLHPVNLSFVREIGHEPKTFGTPKFLNFLRGGVGKIFSLLYTAAFDHSVLFFWLHERNDNAAVPSMWEMPTVCLEYN